MIEYSAVIGVVAEYMGGVAGLACFIGLCIRLIRILVRVVSGREELL